RDATAVGAGHADPDPASGAGTVRWWPARWWSARRGTRGVHASGPAAFGVDPAAEARDAVRARHPADTTGESTGDDRWGCGRNTCRVPAGGRAGHAFPAAAGCRAAAR